MGAGGFSRPLSRPGRPLAAIARCCCFARGLWEVLLLRGQAGAPPSSCFDRHPALAHSHRRFPCSARCGGFWRKGRKATNRASPHKVQQTGAALCIKSVSVVSQLALTPKDPPHHRLKARRSFFSFSFFFSTVIYFYPNPNVCEMLGNGSSPTLGFEWCSS